MTRRMAWRGEQSRWGCQRSACKLGQAQGGWTLGFGPGWVQHGLGGEGQGWRLSGQELGHSRGPESPRTMGLGPWGMRGHPCREW